MVGPMSTPIDTIAILGAGTMGCGLAQVALEAGFAVRLADARPDALQSARDRIAARLERSGASPTAGLVTGDVAAVCTGTKLVIEAVFEDVAVKSEVLSAAERAVGPGAVLATNTSGLPVGVLAAALADPTRFIGMHFFNPVHRMALCEVIPGEATSVGTVAIAREVAERLGKTPVLVSDSPGFVASRLNCALGNEALRMLESGVADAAAIDTGARLGLNHPMGPLELLDLVGLDVRLAALRTLERAYGERFRPTRLHEELVAQGRLGAKTRAGIYTYDENGKRLSE
jgi:3-hydroxybutyryl-CoA dehydrogenase